MIGTPRRRSECARRARRLSQPGDFTLEGRVLLSAGDPSSGGGSGAGGGSGVAYSFTNWPAEALRGISLTAENTVPIVGPKGQSIRAGDWVIRDPYPMTTLDGTLARIDGWYVVAGLAAPRGQAGLREFGYLISRDGVNWQEGGSIISTDTPGIDSDQLFSGDVRYDPANNRILIYYTAVPAERPDSPSGPQIVQEMGVATATPVPSDAGLTFTNVTDLGIKLTPDGAWYAKPEEANTETEVYGFRDPFIFVDPASDITYMTFVGNWGTDQTVGLGSTGDAQFPQAGPQNVDPTRPRNDGVVGLAYATDASLTNWELLPPIFGGIGVNSQLELPHVIHQDGRYYLFFITHDRTFIGDLKYDYPEGLYGFVADAIQGPWKPLNGTSLVLANPAIEPLQNYGWKVTPTGDDGQAQVMSFINKGDSSTIAPALQITIRGDTAVLSGMQPASGLPLSVYANSDMPLHFGVTTTVTQLPADTTRPFVRGLYQSLLGRGAASSEVDYWSDQMRRGFTQDQIRGFFMQTPEYRPRGFVTGLFRDLLGREPAVAEVTIWADRLNSGWTEARVRQGFLDSDEYRARFPTRPAQAAVTATPVVAGLDAWRGRRAMLAARFTARRFRFA